MRAEYTVSLTKLTKTLCIRMKICSTSSLKITSHGLFVSIGNNTDQILFENNTTTYDSISTNLTENELDK